MMATAARSILDAAMSEKEWQRLVVEYAEANNWTVWHDADARRNDSGFPDLVLIRERVVWVELKRVGKRPTKVQAWFHAVLADAGQEIYVWTPSEWPHVMAVLA